MAIPPETSLGPAASAARPRVLTRVREAPVAHRIALLCMLVYISKIGNIFPAIGSLQLGKILIGATLISLVFEGGGWWEGLTRQPAIRALLVIVALAFLTAPFGIWRSNSLDYITQVFIKDLIFFFLLIVTLPTHAYVRRAIWMFALSAGLMDIMLLKYGLPGIGQFTLGKNETAMTSTLAAALLIPLQAQGARKLVKHGLIALLVVSILITGSRGSYLGIAIVLATFTYLRVGKRIAVTGLILAAVAYVGYLNMPASIMGNVDSIVNYKEDYNITAPDGRIEVWKRGLRMIEQHPLTGVGINNFSIAEGMMHRYVQGENWMQPHNSYIQVAAELGILAFVAFIALLRRLVRAANTLRTEAQSDEERRLGLASWLVLIGFMVTGFFLHAAYATIFFVMVAIIVALNRIHAVQTTEQA